MRRFADLFIAICIPIVALSVGAIAYWQFAASATGAAAAGAVVLLVLTAIHWTTSIRRRRGNEADRLEFIVRRIADVAADVGAVERRLLMLEEGGARARREEIDQVVAEVEVIGTLTRQVIEAVADLEVQFTETRSALIRGDVRQEPRRGLGERPSALSTGRAAPAVRSELVPERFADLDEDGFLAYVRRAIDADRIDLHLQPIVSLPQRKVRFYEALTRLRGDDGAVIHPSDYIPIAEARGLMASIDEQILIKSVAILRRLAERSREIGVFLNLSSASLSHAGFFRDFLQFMEKNRDLADMLVLEFPQASVRAMGPIENEGMKALKELGFRFSIDQMTDLKISFQNLADRGFRWAKISAERLLHKGDELGTDIHPVDLTDYFRRFGMELIADHVERETEVVDVLDYGVRLGQGNLFAPPRPVRVEAMQAEKPQPQSALARAAAATRPVEPPPAPEPTPQAVAARIAAQRGAETRTVEARPAAPKRPAPARAPAAEEAPRPGIRIVPAGTPAPARRNP